MMIRSSRNRLSRRTLLGGAGVALALPMLEAMRPPRARAASVAIANGLVMFTANGTIHSNWVPSGTETAFTLSPILMPLAPYQADLVVVDGVYQQGGGGDGHQNGMGGMLTGQALNPGPFAGTGAAPAGWAAGPSVDQRIAEVLGGVTPFRSLELGVQVGEANNWGRMSYRAANQPLVPEDDPARVYERVFADFHADPAALAKRRARHKSILDAVAADIARVGQRLSVEDRPRLDAHLTAVRELETRLTTSAAPSSSSACQDPLHHERATTDNDAFPQIGATQIDLLVMALACDVTRVASLQWSRSVSQTRFTWLGIDEGHHELWHLGDDDSAAVEKLTKINQWYASQLATLLGKLKAIPEGDGTLLDNCIMMYGSAIADPNRHAHHDLPVLLVGRSGGTIKSGRDVRYKSETPLNNLWLAMLDRFGAKADKLGDSTGALDGLA